MSAFDPSKSTGDEASRRENAYLPLYARERERLATLGRFQSSLQSDDPLMLSVACQATSVCNAPVGFVSILEENEERFVACVGYRIARAERSASFCAHTILEPDATVVEDTLTDPRYRDNPFVVGSPYVRFYAGAPIFAGDGMPLGAVCVVDYAPREVSSKCLLALRTLAAVASAVLETRRLFAASRHRESSEEAKRIAQERLDDLLLTLVEPRNA